MHISVAARLRDQIDHSLQKNILVFFSLVSTHNFALLEGWRRSLDSDSTICSFTLFGWLVWCLYALCITASFFCLFVFCCCCLFVCLCCAVGEITNGNGQIINQSYILDLKNTQALTVYLWENLVSKTLVKALLSSLERTANDIFNIYSQCWFFFAFTASESLSYKSVQQRKNY